MNSIQRAWCQVIRKPIKSILLLLVIVAVNLFILCGIACKDASIETQDTARQAVGAGLRLDANEKNRSERLTKYSEKIGNDVEGSYGGVHQKRIETEFGTQWQVWTDNSFETLKIADIEKIAEISGIGDFNISTCITPVHPVNFRRIEDPDVDQYSDLGGVSLIGNRKSDLDFNMMSGNVILKEGRMITENDTDVCIISEQLAKENECGIGNLLQFNDYHATDSAQAYAAEIIGIYRTKQPISALMPGDTFRSENIIFTDLHFPEKAEGHNGDPCFEHAYFQVTDVDEYDRVKADIEAVDIDWARYDLIDRNGNMSIMSTNFNDLEKISSMLVVITFITGFVILFLIFVFWIKNRNHEIGILISLGNKKSSILRQLIAEVILIAALSFPIAFLLAPIVSDAAANYLVSEQVEDIGIRQEIDAGKLSDNQSIGNPTVVDVHVEITSDMFIFCVISTTALLSLSVVIASVSILKKKPQEIFSELS